jgi:hypothetical protein
MAEYTKKLAGKSQNYDAHFGNKTTLEFRLATNSSGVVLDKAGTGTTALTSGDTVLLGILRAGTRLFDGLSIVSDVFTASSTVALGFKYVDGVDDSDVPQDADYFHAALALDAQGRTRANNVAVAPITLPKDAYLYVTHSAHTQATDGIVDFLLDVIMKGPA